MAKKLIIVFLISLFASAICTFILAKTLKKRARQPILKYVTEHFSKSGTPTGGGAAFILVSLITFFLSGSVGVVSTAAAVIFFSYGVIGFCDDVIKIKYAKNEGLTPIQKIVFQTLVAIVAIGFCRYQGLTKTYLPVTLRFADIGAWFYPLGIFAFLATVNCVNLTDGLDGLATTVSMIALSVIAVLILVQTKVNGNFYLIKEEYESLSVISICTAGSLLGFLLFNVNRASIFMGDTGSLALGGLIASVYTFSGNILFIPIVGVCFLISGASVIVQVAYYKKTKRRVFLMAPVHHHFQHKGYTESKITAWYGVVTFALGLITIVRFL